MADYAQLWRPPANYTPQARAIRHSCPSPGRNTPLIGRARSITPDSIIVELRDNKIVQWREYFDTFGSVEFETTP